MSHARISLKLDKPDRAYQPGEVLAGEYRVEGIEPDDLRAVELSVVWHTEGTGDEDLAVHFFERLSPEEGHEFDPHAPQRFSHALPNSPLSYDGVIVKVRWCVRVRAFLRHGKDVLAELPFRLGAVPPAHPPEAP
jgi:hypothetical protein